MWHCSVAPVRGKTVREADLKAIAHRHLSGVGDASLGEWLEWTGHAYHVRRRLTPAEQLSVGDAVDLRGTEEAARRLETLRGELPEAMLRMAREELGGPRC